MNRLVILISALVFSIGAIAGVSFSEEIEYGWGTLVSISSDEIVLAKYDYDMDKTIDVSYKISEDTKAVNVESLDNISIGMEVEVEFIVSEGENIAKAVTLIEVYEDEEMEHSDMISE